MIGAWLHLGGARPVAACPGRARPLPMSALGQGRTRRGEVRQGSAIVPVAALCPAMPVKAPLIMAGQGSTGQVGAGPDVAGQASPWRWVGEASRGGAGPGAAWNPLAGLTASWPGASWRGLARRDSPCLVARYRLIPACRGWVGRGGAGRGTAGLGWARLPVSWLGRVRPGEARRGTAWQGRTRHPFTPTEVAA